MLMCGAYLQMAAAAPVQGCTLMQQGVAHRGLIPTCSSLHVLTVLLQAAAHAQHSSLLLQENVQAQQQEQHLQLWQANQQPTRKRQIPTATLAWCLG